MERIENGLKETSTRNVRTKRVGGRTKGENNIGERRKKDYVLTLSEKVECT